VTVFANNDRDKLQYLGWAANEAMKRTCSNRIEARQLLAGYIRQDRRFDGLDPAKLAQRVDELRSNGAQLDFTDPRLRGLPPRPLQRDQSW
jgi:hypothetical protein